jgi:hydroxyquinol 1,2-dioxygenase
MRNFNEINITTAFIERLAECSSPRIRQISESLVTHLYDFIRDIEPTEDEWRQAIAFLTTTGQMCSETRQEFILLSDALGASMLTDAINHRSPGRTTETTVLGPFYVENPLAHNAGDLIDYRAGLPPSVRRLRYRFRGEAHRKCDRRYMALPMQRASTTYRRNQKTLR